MTATPDTALERIARWSIQHDRESALYEAREFRHGFLAGALTATVFISALLAVHAPETIDLPPHTFGIRGHRIPHHHKNAPEPLPGAVPGTVTAPEKNEMPPGAPHAGDHQPMVLPAAAIGIGSVAQVPEWVNQTKLQQFNALQAGFAKQMEVPSKARQHFMKSTGDQPGGVAVLIGGLLEERDGSDTEVLFRQESNFIYATGFDHPGARVIIGMDQADRSLPSGEAWLFVPKGNPVWTGRTETLQDYKDAYDVTEAFWIDGFDESLASLNPTTVFTFSGVNNIAIPETAIQDTTMLRAALAAARVVKTAGEIAMLRAAAEISVEAHIITMQNVKCGNYESEAESLFRFVGHNYGARFQAYVPIVGGGQNSAALHYNDNDEVIPQAGVVLIDAGAEIGGTRNGGGWTTDITRTWPCSGRFTPEQKAIYDIEYKAQDRCLQMCVPGETMARATAEVNRIIVEGLLELGILKGTVTELLARRIYSTFMPHGLGHSVGLDVHDPGSINPFKAGMVVTCEPGIYFIESLLASALANPQLAPLLDKAVLDRYSNIGGVRLEDTILITDGKPENLSGGAPRTSAEIEAVMAAGRASGASNAKAGVAAGATPSEITATATPATPATPGTAGAAAAAEQ